MTNVPIDMNTTCGRNQSYGRDYDNIASNLHALEQADKCLLHLHVFFPGCLLKHFFWLLHHWSRSVGRYPQPWAGRNGIDLPRQLVGDAHNVLAEIFLENGTLNIKCLNPLLQKQSVISMIPPITV